MEAIRETYRPSRIAWSVVFGGAFVALATFVVAIMLGVAVRPSLYDTAAGQAAPSAGAGAGAAWLAVSFVISLFVGGLVTGRLLSYSKDILDAGLHGLILWGLVTVVMLYFAAVIVPVATAIAATNPQVSQILAQKMAAGSLQVGWMGFAALVAAAGAAVLGGTTGVPGVLKRRERRDAEGRIAPATPMP